MTKIWGHRGASAVKPENTLDAFAEALRLGADGVELDVRRTKDGALAVHHNADLPDGRLIVELATDALPASVPSLADALDACGPMTVNVEIKNVPIDPDFDPTEAVAGQVVDLVVARGAVDRIVVSSFGLAAIDAVRARDAGIATGWLTLPSYDQLRALDTAIEHGHNALNPFHSAVTPELVEAAHAAGLAINTWTVDEPDDIRRLADFGVDVIITNDVAGARRALQR
jgi:glycerophosphoryl diester phosphodiesterase